MSPTEDITEELPTEMCRARCGMGSSLMHLVEVLSTWHLSASVLRLSNPEFVEFSVPGVAHR